VIPLDLLHSNRPPNETEVTEIQAYIAQLNSALAQLQLRRSKHTLCLRESIQKQLFDHKSVLSPFRRLPYEIISMIFLMCPQGESLTDAPLLLCRICSLWRNIALDIPQLWYNPRCAIRLGHFDRAITRLTTWLERSGRDHPLNLSFHLKYCSPHADGYIELFEVARSVSLRWKSLVICLSNSSSAFGLIDQLNTTNIPQLESLTILNLWDSHSHRSCTPPARPLFSAAPALRALTTEGISPTYVRYHVYMNNLTKLYVRNFRRYHYPDEYLQLLVGCSNLTHCAIHCLLDFHHGSHFSPHLQTLPKLVHLQIEGYCPQFIAIGILLDALAFPLLEFVSINFWFDSRYGQHNLAGRPRDAFQTLIERSTHTLLLVSGVADPFLFEMAASVSPTRTIWPCDGEWYHTKFQSSHHQL